MPHNKPYSQNASGADNEQGSPTTTDLAWLAGHFDGDGWIGLTRSRRTNSTRIRYSAQTKVATTSDRIKENLLRIFLELNIHPSIVEFPANFHEERQQWHTRKWNIGTSSNKQTLALLTAIKPYLVEKLIQAELVIDYITWRSTQPRQPGGPKKNQPAILGMKEYAEVIVERLRKDRWRNDPSTTTRLAPANTG